MGKEHAEYLKAVAADAAEQIDRLRKLPKWVMKPDQKQAEIRHHESRIETIRMQLAEMGAEDGEER